MKIALHYNICIHRIAQYRKHANSVDWQMRTSDSSICEIERAFDILYLQRDCVTFAAILKLNIGMKKVLSLPILFLVFSFSLSAQLSVKLGAKGGYNLSDVSTTKGATNFDSYSGYHVGPIAEIGKVNSQFSMIVGAIFAKRGLENHSVKVSNSYVDVPLNLKYRYSFSNFWGAYAFGGPYASFRLDGDDYIKGSGLPDKWNAKTVTGGVSFGAGVSFFKMIHLGAEYQYGLFNDYSSSKYDAKNRSLLFSLGFTY